MLDKGQMASFAASDDTRSEASADALPLVSGMDWKAAAACMAILLAAPVFALLTWQTSYSFTATRHFSVPILAVEIFVILMAFASGFSLPGSIRKLSLLTRSSALVLLAVALTATALSDASPVFAYLLFLSSVLHAIFVLTCWDRFSGDWKQWRKYFLVAVAIGAAIYFAIVFALAYSQQDNPDFKWLNFGPGVSHVRHLGYYGLPLAGIGAGFLGVERTRRAQIFAGLALTLGLWLVIWSGGRAAAGSIVLVLAAMVFLIDKPHRLRFAGLVMLAWLFAIPLSYSFVPHEIWGMDRILDRAWTVDEGEQFASGRWGLWQGTIAGILDRPLIGHGEGQFRFGVEVAYSVHNHPHNALLQFLYQWGILGTLALAGIVFRTVIGLPIAIKAKPELAIPAFGACCGLIVMSALDGSLYYTYPTMVVLIALAILASINGARAESR